MADITILGAGLAGCEAALWLADRGWQVELWEQKPTAYSPAHKSAGFAELVCSNSLKSDRIESAGGLLKAEMRRLGSHLLPIAAQCSVAAGGLWPWTGTSYRPWSPRRWKTTPTSRCSAARPTTSTPTLG